MNRRDFIHWVGVAGIASYLPVAIASCSSTAGSKTAASPDAEGFIAVGTAAALNKEGQIFSQPLASDPVLVVQDLADSDFIIAVNPTCTHAGCTVEWVSDQRIFGCPCHGAKFARDGSVLHGPAQKALTTYTTRVTDGSVFIKVS